MHLISQSLMAAETSEPETKRCSRPEGNHWKDVMEAGVLWPLAVRTWARAMLLTGLAWNTSRAVSLRVNLCLSPYLVEKACTGKALQRRSQTLMHPSLAAVARTSELARPGWKCTWRRPDVCPLRSTTALWVVRSKTRVDQSPHAVASRMSSLEISMSMMALSCALKKLSVLSWPFSHPSVLNSLT